MSQAFAGQPMKLHKDGKEYCVATFLGEFWHDFQTGDSSDRELRYALAIDQPIDPPGMNEVPQPVWEYEGENGRRKFVIRRDPMPDDMKIVVVFL